MRTWNVTVCFFFKKIFIHFYKLSLLLNIIVACIV